MADIFVSYAREDRSLAERTVRAIEAAGYSVWWDDRLTPTESWDRLIEQEIADARAVLVLWSAQSVQSDWVRIEANYGKENRKLVQVRLDHTSPPLAFSLLQHIDLSAWDEAKPHPNWPKFAMWLSLATGITPITELAGNAPRPINNVAYWDAYHIVAERHGVRRPMLSPVKGQNYYLYLSKKPEFCVAGYIARSKGGEIGAYAAMWYAPSKFIFQELHRDRDKIEAEFGAPLTWRQTAETTYWISATTQCSPDDKLDWPRQHEWLAKNIASLKKIMEPRLPGIVATLPPELSSEKNSFFLSPAPGKELD